MKPPAVRGRIHRVRLWLAKEEEDGEEKSTESVPPPPPLPSTMSTVSAPRKVTRLMVSWALKAAQQLKPDRRRMALSAISWGISWMIMASVVRAPVLKETRKEAATDMPCVKLSSPFASRFRYPVTSMGCE